MPTCDTTLALLDESWDSPTEDFSAWEESGEEQASTLTLDEQWMAVHGIPAPAWAEAGFVGIKQTWHAALLQLLGRRKR